LESAVGRKLFQRTSDGFVLTDEGLLMMSHGERMEEEALTLQRQLVGSEQALEGALRLSCSDWFGLHVLSPILADFANAHPRVVVELLTESRFSSLARREADLVFRIRPLPSRKWFRASSCMSRMVCTCGQEALYPLSAMAAVLGWSPWMKPSPACPM